MKLPSDNENKAEEGAGASNDSNNDPAGAEAGSQPGPSASGSSSGSSGGANNSTQQTTSSSNQSSNPEVDFSEYLWMENEEEFDSQVLQELEDEEMINYYYELYEASLNENGTFGPNTANIRVTGPPPPFDPSSNSQEDDPVESLTQGISSRLTIGNSRLNPEAAEFVPRAGNTMSSPN